MSEPVSQVSGSPAPQASGLQVIGAGFGRTGTSSLKAALLQLGFGPCYHMWEVLYRPDRARMWERVGQGEQIPFSELFDGYRATVDWPGAAYWRELVDAYPDAKVVLTVRDPEKWYESARKTIMRFPLRRHNWIERMLYSMLKHQPGAADVPRMLDAVLWDRVFGGYPFDGKGDDQKFAVEAFHRHIDEVKSYVPADRLLIFDVAEGWEPLCAFLGVPVPSEPFPQLNETKEFTKMLNERRWSTIRPWAIGGTVVAAVAIALAVLG
jgi:hypothetical protein